MLTFFPPGELYLLYVLFNLSLCYEETAKRVNTTFLKKTHTVLHRHGARWDLELAGCPCL